MNILKFPDERSVSLRSVLYPIPQSFELSGCCLRHGYATHTTRCDRLGVAGGAAKARCGRPGATGGVDKNLNKKWSKSFDFALRMVIYDKDIRKKSGVPTDWLDVFKNFEIKGFSRRPKLTTDNNK